MQIHVNMHVHVHTCIHVHIHVHVHTVCIFTMYWPLGARLLYDTLYM